MAKQYYHLPNSYGDEGVDHVNISSSSEFHIGKIFEPSFLRVINYPLIGKFRSVSNLWVWLKVKPIDDRLRRVGVREVQKILTDPSRRDSYAPNFKLIIAYATYLKIKDDATAIAEIKKIPKDTPILSYYIPKGSPIRICSNYADVIVPIVNEIIKAVQENREPDFLLMSERGLSMGMHYLEPFLADRLGNKRSVRRYVR